MDDSLINPILLSSSVYLENVEKLIKNLEKQTFNVKNSPDISDNHNKQEITINDINTTYPNNSNENLSTNNIFTQYDIQANYRLTFNTDKTEEINEKSPCQKTNSTSFDEVILSNVANHMSFEQSINKSQQTHSQSNLPCSSPSSEQQILNHNNSSGSSTTTSSSSTSWRQMKENQRTLTEIDIKANRSSPSLNLYKIFQQKSHLSPNTFHFHQQHHDVTDQAVQTSILLDNQYQPSSNTISKSKSYNHLTTPSSFSLPDLSFISHYSKEFPRSLSTSSSSINISRTTPSPTLIQQQKHDSDRPRTLKSIKRYKNSKHSTEPLNVFYSPQLRKPSKQTSNSNSQNLSHLKDDQTKKSVNFAENILKQYLSPCNPSNTTNDRSSLLTKRYSKIRRCQTDIIVVDPILHRHSFTDSPPNEFCLQADEEDDEILMEKSHINIIPISDQSLNSMNTVITDKRISDIIKRLFEIKRTNKTFFLNNEQNLQLDYLLKNDLCPAIQNILEHGRKDLKKTSLWKIIQLSIEQNPSSSQQISRVYYEAKQIAQNVPSNWIYKFQAFIFALLNKNELINWLYYFSRQKDLIQRYYQSPDALILVSISSTFNLFERIMTQLEKLTSLAFHLTYHPPLNDNQLNISIINTNPKDWVMTLSRRSTKNFNQSIHSNDTFRSTLSRKFTSIFMKKNTSSVVTTKLPESYLTNTIPNSIGNNLSNESIPTFQSKIPRPSLNVDKPKSVRYRSTTLSSK